MKIKLEELTSMIKNALDEAKKKKDAPDDKSPETSSAYIADPNFDLSCPLGADNLYKRQGAANMGTFTEEKALRAIIRKGISEALPPKKATVVEKCDHSFVIPEALGVWGSLSRLSEATCEKCGSALKEKHVGFKKLKRKLAHKKGVKNAGALAASIGRKKYGAKGMAKLSAAGRKK